MNSVMIHKLQLVLHSTTKRMISVPFINHAISWDQLLVL